MKNLKTYEEFINENNQIDESFLIPVKNYLIGVLLDDNVRKSIRSVVDSITGKFTDDAFDVVRKKLENSIGKPKTENVDKLEGDWRRNQRISNEDDARSFVGDYVANSIIDQNEDIKDTKKAFSEIKFVFSKTTNEELESLRDELNKKEITVLKEGFLDKTSKEFQYHVNNGLDLSTSVFRTGSESYKNLFEETKKYWDEDNIILSGKSGWMAKNLEVGKKAKYETEDGKMIDVELDTPARGGEKKYFVYHNSGKTDDDGNILATRISWGNPGMPIKNADPGAASSFWARQQCDLKKKMDPSTPGFWACYAPSLFTKQLGLESDEPW